MRRQDISRVLFTDIDGVLNSVKTNSYWSPYNQVSDYRLDEGCCNLLMNALAENQQIFVVISSGWVKHRHEPEYRWDMGVEGHPGIKSLIPDVERMLGSRCIGCVDYVHGLGKSGRILKWIRDNGMYEKVGCRFFVFDDDRSQYHGLEGLDGLSGGSIKVHFTDRNIGLAQDGIREMVDFLGV